MVDIDDDVYIHDEPGETVGRFRPDVGVSRVAEFWPMGLRDPLPIVPVPLRSGDADALVDLKAALDGAYDAVYESRIDKRGSEPPPSPEDEAWAREFLPRAT